MPVTSQLNLSYKLQSALDQCAISYTKDCMCINPPNKKIASLLCESARVISKEAKVTLDLNVSLNWESVMRSSGVFEFPITEI